ncbi:LacI family DNA-binding transcriptional regulator [Clostridium magnum]|uniref:HTH-type transcriptional regulator DegA n=1 Tax=Clostridium magnum DSM 2767 TaxID=1121326 RepID=A0A162RN91_9CLOT|nr:LacI family DNA-binding transcriptional regulator [Clostridium magnum]KZL90157.1 HTH-type transcriptional regulator DegA [Clostridium magnum DSM 2767]SHH62623.1 transcriptional regulator, LacI family [Clostridium magnum DSM 2767]
MKNEKYTISDVAKMLGVSRSTVSRAISNSPGVGDELRKKVLDFVDKIGYKPNTIAQSLSKGKINIIALIFGDVRNPFYADLAFNIQKILSNNGYMVMVFNSEYEEKNEIEFIRLAQQFNFAGLILLTAQTDEIKNELKTVNMPVVLVNRILDSYDGDSVLLDNFQAGYIAVRHLIELGHTYIGFIGGQKNSSAANQRYEGYRQALKNYHLPFNEKSVMYSDLKIETAYEIAKEYVSDIKNRPSALVIINDMTALSFIDYCKKTNIKIPEMLSIVSFDNIVFSAMHDISLTTVSQHVDKMSEHATRLIIKQLEEPDAKSERIILEPKLIIRNSTGPFNPDRFEE